VTTAPTYTVTAHNSATTSENKIHDDAVAARHGFAGGLVPGVDVYAYLTHLPVRRWGVEWLRGGTMSARFVTPVYDGDAVTVTAWGGGHGAGLDLELRDGAGTRCATGAASLAGDAPAGAPGPIERVAPPTERPPTSAAALAPGTVLGAVGAGFHADRAGEYLEEVREASPLYREQGVAHPGWLLRFANRVLVANVRLGPWIHVGSDVHLLGLVRDGDEVEARARVLDEHERKGHRFVVLDVALSVGHRPVQRVTHTAIHQLRAAV
jgi:acyl dehydratase